MGVLSLNTDLQIIDCPLAELAQVTSCSLGCMGTANSTADGTAVERCFPQPPAMRSSQVLSVLSIKCRNFFKC